MKRSIGWTLCVALLTAVGCGDGADEAADGAAPPEAAAPAPEAPEAASPAAGDTGAFLDPNTASAAELQGVEGIDAPLAEALVAGRPYASMLDVDRVVGDRLTEEQKDQVYARVWIPLDLNAAPEEEILLIPGVGPRMAHEFEEYRPYDAIERFRREIGKYVDEAEVARLERYVVIR